MNDFVWMVVLARMSTNSWTRLQMAGIQQLMRRNAALYSAANAYPTMVALTNPSVMPTAL